MNSYSKSRLFLLLLLSLAISGCKKPDEEPPVPIQPAPAASEPAVASKPAATQSVATSSVTTSANTVAASQLPNNASPPAPRVPTTQPFSVNTAPVATSTSPAASPPASTASNTAADYPTQKADFIRGMRTQLDEANKEIDAMDAQVTNARKEDREAVQPKIDILRARAQGIKVQLNNADLISEAGWNNFAGDINKALAELKSSSADTRTWLDSYFRDRKML